MSVILEPSPRPFPPSDAVHWTAADVQTLLGGVPLERIHTFPAPGTATEQDALAARERTGRTCELVDGILVEKSMGTYESRLAIVLIHLIEGFLDVHKLGVVLGESALLKILPTRSCAPDVCFLRWERFPDRRFPQQRVWPVVPDLVVEILSADNTKDEMRQKLRDSFGAGVRLVWYVEPEVPCARVYAGPQECSLVHADGTLSGGDVLPGFELRLSDWLARAQGL